MRRSRTNSEPASSTADAASRERGPHAAARPRVLAEVAGTAGAGVAAAAGTASGGAAAAAGGADRAAVGAAVGAAPCRRRSRPTPPGRPRGGRCGRRAGPAAGRGWRGRRRRPRTVLPTTTPATAAQVSRSWPTVGSSSTSSAGPVGDRAGEGEPAHLAAGEPVGVGAGQGCQPEDPSSASARRPRGVLVQPEQPAGAQHVLAHRAGDDRELGLLRHPADPPCQLRGGPPRPARPRRRRRASPPPPPPRSSAPPRRRAGR